VHFLYFGLTNQLMRLGPVRPIPERPRDASSGPSRLRHRVRGGNRWGTTTEPHATRAHRRPHSPKSDSKVTTSPLL